MTLPLDGVFAVKSSGNGASGARGARLGFAWWAEGGARAGDRDIEPDLDHDKWLDGRKRMDDVQKWWICVPGLVAVAN